jgi:hypothetical protein
MRHLFRVALVGSLLSLTAEYVTAGEPPIPQDPKSQEQRFRDMLAWNRRTLGDAYEKVGKKDPRWDGVAREALDAAARNFSYVIDPETYLGDIHNATQQAIALGCDDPLILYLHARSFPDGTAPGAEELDRLFTAAATGLERSAYPPFRRAVALYRAGLLKANARGAFTPDRLEAAERLFDAALAQLPRSAEEDERTPDMEHHWSDVARSAIKGYRMTGGNAKAAFERVDAALAKTPALKALRLKVKGDFLIVYAWEARGSGVASTVTEEGWQKFHERLSEAREALEEAWSVKPGDSETAARMLTVEKGLSRGRAEMEKWFRRAMTADGNNIHACLAKLDWLDPKWHGSWDEMVAFGRACRDTKNWRMGITLLVAEAHERARWRFATDAERYKYMSSTEVWDDIRTVYTEYLKHYPLDHQARSQYAAYCYLCGRYLLSHHQFLIVGENLRWGNRFPEAFMKEIRAYVAKAAQQPPAVEPAK